MAREYQPVPETAQLVIELQVDAQKVFQTFYFQKAGGWDQGDLESLTAAAAVWWSTSAADFFTTAVQQTRITATDLSSLNSLRYVDATSPPATGTIVGDYVPLNACLSIHLDIGNRGRGRNGRTFWPAIPEAQVTANTHDSITAGQIVTSLQTLKADVASATGGVMVIPHRKVGDTWLPIAVPQPVISISYRDLSIDSQKNRLPGHKRHKRKPVPAPAP